MFTLHLPAAEYEPSIVGFNHCAFTPANLVTLNLSMIVWRKSYPEWSTQWLQNSKYYFLTKMAAAKLHTMIRNHYNNNGFIALFEYLQ